MNPIVHSLTVKRSAAPLAPPTLALVAYESEGDDEKIGFTADVVMRLALERDDNVQSSEVAVLDQPMRPDLADSA